MKNLKVLLVDDDEVARLGLTMILEQSGFEVTSAANVSEALKYISTGWYDVLLSDLHMPGAGDGLTVVSAMKHANPAAATLLLSAFPEMTAAAQAILQQADEILVKPIEPAALVRTIHQLAASGGTSRQETLNVAAVLERNADAIVQEWYERVEKEPKLAAIAMTSEQRCRHVAALIRDIAQGLRSRRPLGTAVPMSNVAAQHGLRRLHQKYTAAMLVEESRLLQASIFHFLQRNLAALDLSVLLFDLMAISDELALQLSHTMESFLSDAYQSATA
jgi:YesN/AraC family two-component response regulator